MNAGEAVWLDRAQWEKGEVLLRWRWFEEGQEDPVTQGGWLIRSDVPPGQHYEFIVGIVTPKKPAQYLLDLAQKVARAHYAKLGADCSCAHTDLIQLKTMPCERSEEASEE
jgi:hypothetical protein